MPPQRQQHFQKSKPPHSLGVRAVYSGCCCRNKSTFQQEGKGSCSEGKGHTTNHQKSIMNRWIQVDSGGFRWIQVDSGGFRWIQILEPWPHRRFPHLVKAQARGPGTQEDIKRPSCRGPSTENVSNCNVLSIYDLSCLWSNQV